MSFKSISPLLPQAMHRTTADTGESALRDCPRYTPCPSIIHDRCIRGFAETLLEDDPPDGLRQEFLASIRNNTVRLQLMVDDLLDLSRLESGG